MYLYDSRNEHHKRPLGAVRASGDLCITVIAIGEKHIPQMLLRKDGEDVVYVDYTDVLTDGDRMEIRYELKLNDIGLYFYCFTIEDAPGIFEDGKGSGIRADGGNWFIQSVYDPSFSTPDCFKGGVFYQIFPDRFFEGDPSIHPALPDRVYRSDKDGIPFYKEPDEFPEEAVTSDYFGGDLKGIILKIGYIRSLGVTGIYLNPIFLAHQDHRYNTADYMQIDPDLGTLEDFRALCSVCHDNGIKVILDGVFSHTGSDSIYFNKEKRYGEGGAYNDPDSPYRKWYIFGDEYRNGYRSWWDFPALPEVNEEDPDYCEFICGDSGVIDYWISNGADGFRLDVADELPDSFIEKIRRRIKKCGEDKLLIGEVWENAVTKVSFGYRRQYLLGRGLDGTMNYPFRNMIIDFVKSGDSYAFCEDVLDICDLYPEPSIEVMWNMLSSHDTERALTAIAGENCEGKDRRWQAVQHLTEEEYELAVRKLICATALQFTLPGIPCIYYGDEAGVEGYKDPFNRTYFPWDHKDERLVDRIRRISLKRHSSTVYRSGKIMFVYLSDGVVAFIRYDSDSRMLTAVNVTDRDRLFYFDDREFRLSAYGWLIEEV